MVHRLLLLIYSLFYLFLVVPQTQALSIDVILLGYEDVEHYDDKSTCKLEFTIVNNSWGTLYGLTIETEVFDDRGDKMEDYAYQGNIKAFKYYSSNESIKLGNAATNKSLELRGKCKYVKDIYLKEVKPKECSIRMMPEDADCLTIINAVSKIDHINMINEFSVFQTSSPVGESGITNESSIKPIYFASGDDFIRQLVSDNLLKKTLGTNTGKEIQIDDLFIESYEDNKFIKGGTLTLIGNELFGTNGRISCVVDSKTGDEFMVSKKRQSIQLTGIIKSYDDLSGLIIEPCIILSNIE